MDDGELAATAYEDLFVPALFQEWAPRVADAAGVVAGQRVLDVACGTGVLTRELLTRVGPDGRVAGLDLAPGMLAVARRLAPGVELREGSAGALPWADATFDAVVCQFGLMFFPDRTQALREMLRVLVPGGRLAVAVWAALSDTPAYAEEVALLDRLAGPRAVASLSAPFSLGDRAALARLLEAAGVGSVEVATHQGTGRFPSIRAMVEADLRGWLPLTGVVLDDDLIARILAEAETALARYARPDGTVELASPAHIASGVRA